MHKTPEMRARLSIPKAKALYKILNKYELQGDELIEGMVIQQLNKAIIEFLVVNGEGSIVDVKESLKENAFEDFDWDSAYKALPDNPAQAKE